MRRRTEGAFASRNSTQQRPIGNLVSAGIECCKSRLSRHSQILGGKLAVVRGVWSDDPERPESNSGTLTLIGDLSLIALLPPFREIQC